ncbi:hypothetical protein ABT010_21185 [Streptomyces sp. NPDC002668]|uniref:hypothetical protein n=1 Tax=Streptomyces sp. NPDC002668 TaxID=3154422 RepID=UPI003322615D
MKFVKADWDPDVGGFNLDPSAYLAELPQIREALPVGAREFAFDTGHYSMRSSRCVKDLRLAGIHVPTDKSGILTLEFAPNQWKHDSGLRIRYSGVSHFSIDYEGSIDWMQADTVLLDEILPDGDGCVHEIALTDASIIVRSRDLNAFWDVAEPGGKT